MDDFVGEVDIVQAQAERLSLPESEARTYLDKDPVVLWHSRAHGRHALRQPRLDPAWRGYWRADRTCLAPVAQAVLIARSRSRRSARLRGSSW